MVMNVLDVITCGGKWWVQVRRKQEKSVFNKERGLLLKLKPFF